MLFPALGLEVVYVPAEFGIAPTTPGRGSQLSPPFKLVAPNSDMKEIPATFVVSTTNSMQKGLLQDFLHELQIQYQAAHDAQSVILYSSQTSRRLVQRPVFQQGMRKMCSSKPLCLCRRLHRGTSPVQPETGILHLLRISLLTGPILRIKVCCDQAHVIVTIGLL